MSIKWLIIILKKKFSIFPKERSRLYKNQFRNSSHFVLLKDRSRSEDWLWSIIKIYFLYSYAIKCQSFKQSHLSRVSEIWLVHRSTFICETPGYNHLSAASNAVTRNYFSHNPTIWSKIYLILFKKCELDLRISKYIIVIVILYSKIIRIRQIKFFNLFDD